MEPVQLHAAGGVRHRCVQAVDEGGDARGDAAAVGGTPGLRQKLAVPRLRLDERRPVLLQLDLRLQPLVADLVVADLLLQAVDSVGRLPNDRLQHRARVRVHGRVARELHALERDAAAGVEVVAAAEGRHDDVVEAPHELLQRHVAHRLDQRAPRAVPDVALWVRGHVDHLADVGDLPEDRALERQLHVVARAHLVVVEGLPGAQVDLDHGNLRPTACARLRLRRVDGVGAAARNAGRRGAPGGHTGADRGIGSRGGGGRGRDLPRRLAVVGPEHAHDPAVRLQEEGGALSIAAGRVRQPADAGTRRHLLGATVDRHRALDVAHDHGLVGQDVDERAQLHDLLVRRRREHPGGLRASGDQPSQTCLPVQHDRGRLRVEENGPLRAVGRGFGGRGHDGGGPALHTLDARLQINKPDILVLLQHQLVADLSQLVVGTQEQQLRALLVAHDG
mmetsp:Transcript_46956/g.133988  ORF Transcript_46956/g.133988 Transcript_46956/m.133988 type:complete len:449 (+) Transcript_46956:181-1527(+)